MTALSTFSARSSQPSGIVPLSRKLKTAYAYLPATSIGVRTNVSPYVGYVGKADKFSGSGGTGTSKITLGLLDAADIALDHPFWITVVINPYSLASWSGSTAIAGKSDGNGNKGWILHHDGSGNLTFTTVRSGNSTTSTVGVGQLIPDAINVVTVTGNGLFTTANNTKIFRNGVDITGTSGAGSGTCVSDSTEPLVLGSTRFNSARDFGGEIFLFASGNKQLTAGEARSIGSNPWQVFEGTRRTLIIPDVAGESSTNISVNIAEDLDSISSDISNSVSVMSSISEISDSISSTLLNNISATSSNSEMSDSIGATVACSVGLSVSHTESPDVLSTQAHTNVSVSVTVNELQDSLASAGNVSILSSANLVESPEGASSTFGVILSVSSTTTEVSDSIEVECSTVVVVSSSNAEDSDSLVSALSTTIGGANISVTLVESSDTLGSDVSTQISVSSGYLELPDSSVSQVEVLITLSSTSTESSDYTNSVVVNSIVSVLSNNLENSDTLTCYLTSSLPEISISSALTEDGDTSVVQVQVDVAVVSAITELPDITRYTITYILDRSGVMLNADTGEHEFVHAPSASLDYGFDWTIWLAAGETIVTSDWVVESPLTKSLEQTVDGVTSLFVTGGVIGKIYKVANTITTSLTRTDTRTIKLSCKAR